MITATYTIFRSRYKNHDTLRYIQKSNIVSTCYIVKFSKTWVHNDDDDDDDDDDDGGDDNNIMDLASSWSRQKD